MTDDDVTNDTEYEEFDAAMIRPRHHKPLCELFGIPENSWIEFKMASCNPVQIEVTILLSREQLRAVTNIICDEETS